MTGYHLAFLAEYLGAQLHGDGAAHISAVATLEAATSGAITFLSNSKYRKYLTQTAASAVLISADDTAFIAPGVNALVVKDPYVAFARVAQLLDTTPAAASGSGTVISMPALGESVSEGTVTRWLKNIGDSVAVDEALLEVSTDKVDTEIPSPVAGVLLEIRAEQDSVIAVGGVMAIIGEAGSSTASTPISSEPFIQTPAPKAEPITPMPAPIVSTPVPAAVTTPAVSGSTINVLLPQLGESVTEGTVTRWLKKVGDAVAADEALLEVSTDKVDTEIPSPVAGVLLEIKAAQDSVIPVGGVMAIIGEAGSATPSAPAPVAPVVKTPPPAPTEALKNIKN